MFNEHVERTMFLLTRVRELENLLFSYGAMLKSPCFCCGYNGAGYFQPDIHSCAKRHNDLYEKK